MAEREARARVYVCIECGSEIEHQHKRDMVHAGEWRPGPHAQFPRRAGAGAVHRSRELSHLGGVQLFAERVSWGQLCTEFVARAAKGRST
jgi:hypothetical protein